MSVTQIRLDTQAQDGTLTNAKIKDGEITNGKISTSAGIVYSKLALTNSIVDGDISGTAAIATSKLADGALFVKSDGSVSMAHNWSMGGFELTDLHAPTANDSAATKQYVDNAAAGVSALTSAHIFVGNGSAVATDVAMTGDVHIDNAGATTIQPSAIVDSKVSSSAAIAVSKLAALTASRILASDGAGVISASSTSSTQLSYLDATSSIQTQINSKKTVATGNNYKFETTDASGNLQETTVTASRAVATDANGLPVASSTTATELGYVHGVTSAIQTQIDSKAPSANPTFTGTIGTPLTASSAVATDGSGNLSASSTTSTELGYVHGVTSAIQTQLDGKEPTLTKGNLTDAGTDGITITGGTSSVIGSGTSIAQHVADSSHNGYLSSTDWSTFNAKAPTANPVFTGVAEFADGSAIAPSIVFAGQPTTGLWLDAGANSVNVEVNGYTSTFDNTGILRVPVAVVAPMIIASDAGVLGNPSIQVGDGGGLYSSNGPSSQTVSMDVGGQLAVTFTTEIPSNITSIDVNNGQIHNLADPTADQDAANKRYVDAVAIGLDVHAAVRLASTARLVSTHAGSGVGATLTESDSLSNPQNGALTIDGVPAILNDRVLVKDQDMIPLTITGLVSTNEIHVTSNVGVQAGDIIAEALQVNITTVFSSTELDVTSEVGVQNGDTISQGGTHSRVTSTSAGKIFVVDTTGFTTGNAYDYTQNHYHHTSVTSIGGSTQIFVASNTGFYADPLGAAHDALHIFNGVYTVTQVGDGSNPWILTRATDFDGTPANEVTPGDQVFVTAGTSNGTTSWVVLDDGFNPIAVDVNDIEWAQFSGGNTYTASGQGIKLVGNQFQLSLDGTTLSQSGSGVKVNQIADGQIASGANIALSKLAALTASKALQSDGSGVISASSVTNTELGYVSGVTSAIQTQLDGKEASITTLPISKGGTNSSTALANNKVIISSSGAIVESSVTTTTLGYLDATSSIQTQLDGKEPTLTKGNLTDAGTDGITVTGGTNAVIGSGTSIAQHVADSSHNGYLSSTDWSTFNGKLTSSLTSAEIFVGNGSNVATAVALGGDATISNLGVLTIGGTFLKDSRIVTREVPSGLINTSNVTYTLANTPTAGTEHVFLNGILQNVGGGNDYTISSGTITFASAPSTGSVILVSYHK